MLTTKHRSLMRRPRLTAGPLQDAARQNFDVLKEMTGLRDSELSRLLLEHQLDPKGNIPPLIEHMIDPEALRQEMAELFVDSIRIEVNGEFPNLVYEFRYHAPHYRYFCVENQSPLAYGELQIDIWDGERLLASTDFAFILTFIPMLSEEAESGLRAFGGRRVEKVVWMMEFHNTWL